MTALKTELEISISAPFLYSESFGWKEATKYSTRILLLCNKVLLKGYLMSFFWRFIIPKLHLSEVLLNNSNCLLFRRFIFESIFT